MPSNAKPSIPCADLMPSAHIAHELLILMLMLTLTPLLSALHCPQEEMQCSAARRIRMKSLSSTETLFGLSTLETLMVIPNTPSKLAVRVV